MTEAIGRTVRSWCETHLEHPTRDSVIKMKKFLDDLAIERKVIERAARLQTWLSPDEAGILLIPALDTNPSAFQATRWELDRVGEKPYYYAHEFETMESLLAVALDLQAYQDALERTIACGDIESDDEGLVPAKELARWLHRRDAGHVPQALHRYLPDEQGDDWYTVFARHESELLRCAAAAVSQFWLDYPPGEQPETKDVVPWLRTTYPDLSDNEARMIDRMIRPTALKRGAKAKAKGR